MIKLRKGEEPSVLVKNAARWTAQILEKLQGGEKPTPYEKGRYGHEDIKEALIEETKGKCAYCESKVRHITYGDIEHVVPKSEEPERWFDWSNLTLACDICNTNKASFYGDELKLLDPYIVDPLQHVMFLGETFWPRDGSESAALTEIKLDLNRKELVDQRRDRLTALVRQVAIARRTVDPELRAVLEQDLLKELTADKEYVAMARDFFKQVGVV